MAAMGSAGWESQDQSLPPSEDDFQQFLDMQGMSHLGDCLNFDFQSFQEASNTGGLPLVRREPMDTPMGGTEPSTVIPRTTGLVSSQMQPMATTPATAINLPAQLAHPPTPTDAINEIDAQIQYLQQQRFQQQQRQLQEQQATYYAPQGHGIPPTPQSLEMQPNTQFFTSSEAQAFENRASGRKRPAQHQQPLHNQEMSFTPLVSPAVTPLDQQFNVESSFLGPSYFSPLASPALHAQGDGAATFVPPSIVVKTNSPVELEVDTSVSRIGSSQDLSKRARKNNAAKATKKGAVRQSPISKAQRRKTATNPAIVAQALTEAAEVGTTAERRKRTERSDEDASVSPEALSDMPPPPVPPPKTAGKSPLIHAEMPTSPARRPTATPARGSKKPSPATPASLMKLPSTSSRSSKSPTPSPRQQGRAVAPDAMDSFQLPEAAAPSTGFASAGFAAGHFSPADTAIMSPVDDGGAGPSGAFQTLPSPVFAKPSTPASASQSPQIVPGSGAAAGSTTPTMMPTTSGTGSGTTSAAAGRRTPQLAARGSNSGGGAGTKKRTGSVSVSPALRARISPSIKPLLPGSAAGGSQSAEDTSKLLATKSNYQNILEGNVVPGVSYPSELSTNLTSKRTSHKLAEQGRRNRINSALQEIAALLPKNEAAAEAAAAAAAAAEAAAAEARAGGNGKKEDKSTPVSKANTVEMAIEYIKQLQQEVADATRRAEEAEKQLERSNT